MKLKLPGLVMLCLLLVSGALAQSPDLDTVYDDNGVTFAYNSDWEVEVDDISVVMFGTYNRASVVLAVYFPEWITGMLSDPDDLPAALAALMIDFEFTVDDVRPLGLKHGRETVIAGVQVDALDGYALLSTLSDGNYALMLGLGTEDTREDAREILLLMAETLDAGGTGGPRTTTANPTPGPDTDVPATLDDYGGEWETAIAELERGGLISRGGSLVLEEDYAFFDGVGSWFTSLGQGRTHQDVVVAGELTYTSGSTTEYEACGLLARVQASNRGATIFMEVGLNNDGQAYLLDAPTTGDTVGLVLQAGVDMDTPQHFLIVARRDQVFIYLNGEQITDGTERIEARSGSYGVALIGKGRDSRCEARNLWVYQSPYLEEGVCQITAPRTANKRSGPGTSFGQAGQLRAGASLTAVAFAVDAGGRRWWKLEDETWVREDVVTAAGDCDDLPEE
ncbi:MAG: hypothetical protein MUE40_14640 [Anaerolineae bacterium]|nr:hypothetical protein [Anaerolineae bacterium]